MYSTIMSGTMNVVTLAIDLMPPTRASPVPTPSTTAVTVGGTSNECSRLEAIALPWVMLPIPNVATTQHTANITDRNRPNLLGMPRAR